MPDKEEEMPGELLKVFPANNLQMMFLSGAKGTQVTLFSLPLQWLLSLYLACFLQLLVVVLVPEQYPKKSFWGLLGLLFFLLCGEMLPSALRPLGLLRWLDVFLSLSQRWEVFYINKYLST